MKPLIKALFGRIEISLPMLIALIATPASLYLWEIYRGTRNSAEEEDDKKSKRVHLAIDENQDQSRAVSEEEKYRNSVTLKGEGDVVAKSPRSNPPPSSIPRRQSYRMVEEGTKKSSSEYTRRGQLWSRHASWHLPLAPRAKIYAPVNEMYSTRQGLEHVTAILQKFDVDPRRGFLPSQDPLQRLPYARYHLWEDLGDDLPKLLGARLGQARDPLRQLPVLKTDKLVTDAELRRAHLLLCLFAHAYVWGGPQPLDRIPEGIAVPLCEVSERLGVPPVLGHPSIVLYNWRRLDAEAEICMENLSTLNNFFDGRDESWFYLITVEIEARGAAAVVPLMLSIDAIQRYNEEQEQQKQLQQMKLLRRRSRAGSNLSTGSLNSRIGSYDDSTEDLLEASLNGVSHDHSFDLDQNRDDELDRRLLSCEDDGGGDDNDSRIPPYHEEALIGELTPTRVATYVTLQLQKAAAAIKDMCDSLTAMREGCHPFIFYHRVRPFLSAWKHNPTLPHGVLYEGVSIVRQQYFGGSAAQSSLLPFLDISLGVSHQSTKSNEFLLAMRDYMPRQHREFLVYLGTVACVRQFVVTSLREHDIPFEGSERVDSKPPPKAVETPIRTPYYAKRGPDAANGAASSSPQQGSRYHSIPKQQPQSQSPAPSSANAGTTSTGAARSSSSSGKTKILTEKEKKVWLELRDSYDKCIENLQAFRTGHISLVADYILAQQKKGVSQQTLEGSAGGKGTGGTDLMKFLKPVRDDCGESLLTSPLPKPSPPQDEPPQEAYVKNNGCFEDIDLYRGAAYPAGKMRYTMPVNHGWDFIAQSNTYNMNAF